MGKQVMIGGIQGSTVEGLADALVREALAATPPVQPSGYFARPLCVEELRDLCARVLVTLSGLPVAPAGRTAEAPESTGTVPSAVPAPSDPEPRPETPAPSPARETWQPIETAPTHERVLAYIPTAHRENWRVAHRDESGVWMATGSGRIKPTHWMPLPDPPAPKKGQPE